jgi:uncharacterized protein (TIGR03437 family)
MVRINGQYVPVLYSSSRRVDYQCPAESPGTNLSLVVETASGNSVPLTGTMRSVSPRLLSANGVSESLGIITSSDTGELAMYRNYQIPSRPAQPGDELLIWATGFGSDADRAPETVFVNVGQGEAVVRSVERLSGTSGIYAVRVSVPATVSTGDAVPIRLTISTPAGSIESNTVFASFENVIR